jgi:small redox-active disulfide protein 2
MMEIKILGPGCTKCKKLYEETDRAIQQLGLAATLTKVERIDEIAAHKVFMTPALVINGEVKSAGRVPNAAELTSWLTTAAANQEPR